MVYDPQGAHQAVEQYKRARGAFAEAILELVKTPQNDEVLLRLDVVTLLRPLLADAVSGVQLLAANALGRLASHSVDIASSIGQEVTLSHLVHLLLTGDKQVKCAAAYLLRSVARHSSKCACAVANAGAISPLIEYLSDPDPAIQEAGAWTLGYLAKNTSAVAEQTAFEGALPALAAGLAANKPLQLRLVAASALGDIARHSASLAQAVVDAGAVDALGQLAAAEDTKLARQGCGALANILQYNIAGLASAIAESGLPPLLLHHVEQAADEGLRVEATRLLKELLSWAPEARENLLGSNGASLLIAVIKESSGMSRMAALKAIGLVAGSSPEAAQDIISKGGMSALVAALADDPEVESRAAAAGAISAIAGHSAEHGAAAIKAGALPALLVPSATPRIDTELAYRSRSALKALVQWMDKAAELDTLLRTPLPEGVLLMVLQKLPEALEEESARDSFQTSGGLALIQQLNVNPNKLFARLVSDINALFPAQAVLKYNSSYSPDDMASCAMQPEAAGAAGLGIPSRLRKSRIRNNPTSAQAQLPQTGASYSSALTASNRRISLPGTFPNSLPPSKPNSARGEALPGTFPNSLPPSKPTSARGESGDAGKRVSLPGSFQGSLPQSAAPSKPVSRTGSGVGANSGEASDGFQADSAARRISLPGTFPNSLPPSKPASTLPSARGVNQQADVYVDDALSESIAAATAALAKLSSGRISRSGSGLSAQLRDSGAGDALDTLAAIGNGQPSRTGSELEAGDYQEGNEVQASGDGGAISGYEQSVEQAAEHEGEEEEQAPRYTLAKLPSIPEQASMEDLAGLPSGASSAIRVA